MVMRFGWAKILRHSCLDCCLCGKREDYYLGSELKVANILAFGSTNPDKE